MKKKVEDIPTGCLQIFFKVQIFLSVFKDVLQHVVLDHNFRALVAKFETPVKFCVDPPTDVLGGWKMKQCIFFGGRGLGGHNSVS